MKKTITMLLLFCLLFTCLPQCVFAAETPDTDNASAVIVDKDGNIIETLEIEVSTESMPSNNRNIGTTHTITYTARSTSTTSDTSDPKDGVTATLTISWNDFLGTTNQLVSVSGAWAVGDESISNRKVYYIAQDFYGNILQSLSKTPSENSFIYEPTNFTGYRFTLTSVATIDSSGNKLNFSIST